MDVAVLERIGGRRWQKNGMDRVYFNDLAGWLGLETSRYNTGNISGATLNGEHLSNTKARKMIVALMDAKVWYDVPSGSFQGRNIAQADLSDIVAAIEARVQPEAQAAQEASGAR